MAALHTVDDSVRLGEAWGRSNDGAMAVRRHPEPDRRLERNCAVLGNLVRVGEEVQAQVLAAQAVVVVPRQLQRPTAVVVLSRGTRVLGVGLVAVIV
jgi:hypothetical protein